MRNYDGIRQRSGNERLRKELKRRRQLSASCCATFMSLNFESDFMSQDKFMILLMDASTSFVSQQRIFGASQMKILEYFMLLESHLLVKCLITAQLA